MTGGADVRVRLPRPTQRFRVNGRGRATVTVVVEPEPCGLYRSRAAFDAEKCKFLEKKRGKQHADSPDGALGRGARQTFVIVDRFWRHRPTTP